MTSPSGYTPSTCKSQHYVNSERVEPQPWEQTHILSHCANHVGYILEIIDLWQMMFHFSKSKRWENMLKVMRCFEVLKFSDFLNFECWVVLAGIRGIEKKRSLVHLGHICLHIIRMNWIHRNYGQMSSTEGLLKR